MRLARHRRDAPRHPWPRRLNVVARHQLPEADLCRRRQHSCTPTHEPWHARKRTMKPLCDTRDRLARYRVRLLRVPHRFTPPVQRQRLTANGGASLLQAAARQLAERLHRRCVRHRRVGHAGTDALRRRRRRSTKQRLSGGAGPSPARDASPNGQPNAAAGARYEKHSCARLRRAITRLSERRGAQAPASGCWRQSKLAASDLDLCRAG